jgi:tripartite-type tricarboxylate transporter receptor subunit TctC
MAKHLSTELGVRVNVVNRPGGNQITAVLSVVNATPDGYSLLQENSSTSSAHAVIKDLPYKWQERTWGPMMVQGQHVFVISGKSPLNSLKEVVALVKKEPNAFTWTYLGGGSVTDFVIAQLIGAAGLQPSDTKPVAFDGGGPGVTAVAGGHVVLTAVGVSAALPLLASGDLKAIAVTGDSRAPSLPNVPTTKEAGVPEINVTVWWGFSGPPNLPKPILERLDRAAKKVVENAEYQKDQVAVSNQPKYLSPEQLERHVRQEAETLRELSASLRVVKK